MPFTPQVVSSSMEKHKYRYRPLPNNETIRILVLDPGQHNDPLTGTLQVVPIHATGDYEAVSYVWADPGPPNRKYNIMIRNGDDNPGLLTLSGGGSITAALRQMRLPNQPRRVWADQCCINQSDPAERSQQMQFMSKIYENASHVLVWLGLDTENEAVSAFRLVHELDNAFKSRSLTSTSQNLDTVDLERHVKENQKYLRALTDRSWEIGLDTPATMMWGDAVIEWVTLAEVCERLKRHHLLRSTLGITTSDISFLYRRFIEPHENTHHANRYNFIYELQRSRHLRFSDDRDRVFAFLGHFSLRSLHRLGCGPVSIVPDYEKTVEQTYINVAVQMLQANPAAACILLAAVQHKSHGHGSLPSRCGTAVQTDQSLETWLLDEQLLPSWVPDWRWTEAIILAEPICPHQAQGESITKLEILKKDALVLRISGTKIDTIDEYSWPLASKDFYDTKALDQTHTPVERLWHDICRKEQFNLEDKYLNGEETLFAFMQTLSNGCVQAAGHDGKSYHEISDRVWLQKAARYLVEMSDRVSEEVVSVAKGAAAEGDHETWSRWAASASEGRVFARTASGYFVLGPTAMGAGDVVCVLFGAKVLFCLRPMGNRYLLVGECYVHGLMKGEAMSMLARDELQEMAFDIV